MKQHTLKYVRIALSAVGVVGTLVACNSHVLLKSGDPEVTVIEPPPAPPPPSVSVDDAGLPTTVFTPVTLTGLPDGGVADAPILPPGTDGSVRTPDAKPIDLPPPPPPTETLTCPTGQFRVHVRDLWSSGVDPTLSTQKDPPLGVTIIEPTGSYPSYGARVDGIEDVKGGKPCTYYSVCIPTTATTIQIRPIAADGCPGTQSASFDLSKHNKNKEVWIEHTGSSATLKTDYTTYPNVPISDGHFRITPDAESLKAPACKLGTPPELAPPSGFIKVHFRWPFSDPVKTGYPGSGCGDDKLGFSPPPYPSSLTVRGLGCDMQATLEFQDGKCPWYYVMIPKSAWNAAGKKIAFRFPDETKGLYTPDITLPAPTQDEYWIAYAGAPDNTPASKPMCMDWSLQSNTYFVYTQNPGPGYEGCGGDVKIDPCSPPQPDGYHTVHFRYIWAGQKTFTFFPKPEFMPEWIELEVSSNKVICYREQDRPWFNCPVPDSLFKAGATWRAVDKTHDPEWNTVAPHPFPTTPKDYWIRWYYGKPDVPRTVDPPNFMIYDYYPDGSNGDWSATGVWNDSECAPKPPATPVTVGFGGDAWFPYDETQYKYPYGGSLAYVFPEYSTVQDLFNAFVWERYQIWKKNYVVENACPGGAARIKTDPPETVSEGQGYGIAIAAAIGDKELFDKLWKFVRSYLSQSSDKYCGGLMGWMWQGSGDCRPMDEPCSASSGGCGGNDDSAFDGDVDIAIGLVYAALQWPEYEQGAIDWLVKMECEVNANYDGKFNYPSIGDTDSKSCQNYPNSPCTYAKGQDIKIRLDYYPPGYFRVFGDFLAAKLGNDQKAYNGQSHRDFWYKTAETVYEMLEKCYDQRGVHPGLMGSVGSIASPCATATEGTYEELRGLWRVGIDAAWFGNDQSLPENTPNSSTHYAQKTRVQAKIDNAQNFFTNFYKKNPIVQNANRFSSLCDRLTGAGDVEDCDPAYGHNSYVVNTGMSSYVSLFNDGGNTTSDIRREAIEEAITTTVQNDKYYQESLGVYTILFLTGNYPNPLLVKK